MGKINKIKDASGNVVYPVSVSDAIIDYDRKLQLGDTLSDLEEALLSKGTDGDYVTTTVSAKNTEAGDNYNLNQTIGVSVKILDIATATAGSAALGVEGEDGYVPAVPAALGLVEASNLKDYIDNVVVTGATYSADTTNNSITSGSTTYNLVVDNETHTISLVPYTKITLSLTGNVAYEIDSTTTSRTVTATVGGSNKTTATITWTGSNTGTTTGTGSTMTQTFASATSSTLTAKADDGKTNASASTTVSWNPRVVWGYSTNGSLTNIVDGEGKSLLSAEGYSVQSGSTISNKVIKLTEAGYIYYAVPSAAPGTFYLASLGSSASGDRASLSGGMIKTDNTFTKYTTNTKTYTLFRSTELKAPGYYRLDVL